MLAAMLTLTVAAGGTGYYIRAQQAAVQWQDRLLMDLVLYVTAHDAIESDRVDYLRPMIVAGLESDFYRMVLHWREHGPAPTYDLQCGLAKRVRKMRAEGKLFANEDRAIESGIEMDLVDRYLATECLGDPARDTWIITKGWPDQASPDE